MLFFAALQRRAVVKERTLKASRPRPLTCAIVLPRSLLDVLVSPDVEVSGVFGLDVNPLIVKTRPNTPLKKESIL